jgi:hypothetical protein
MMEEKTVYPQVSDWSTRRNDNFQRQDVSIRKTKKKKILNNKLTDAEKRKQRTHKKRA